MDLKEDSVRANSFAEREVSEVRVWEAEVLCEIDPQGSWSVALLG